MKKYKVKMINYVWAIVKAKSKEEAIGKAIERDMWNNLSVDSCGTEDYEVEEIKKKPIKRKTIDSSTCGS